MGFSPWLAQQWDNPSGICKEGERTSGGLGKAFNPKKAKVHFSALILQGRKGDRCPKPALDLPPSVGALNTHKNKARSALALSKAQIIPVSLLLLTPLTNIITASLKLL